MTHAEFMQRRSFNNQELLAYSNGSLFEDQAILSPSQLILMFDRVVHVQHDDNSGRIVAEQNRYLDTWRAGAFGVDAIWQLLEFYLALRGVPGNAIPLGCKEISCLGQIRAHHTCLRYEVNITQVSRFPHSGASIAIGDGVILAGGEAIYSVREAQVAAFAAISKDTSASSSHRAGKSSLAIGAARPVSVRG